MDKRYQVFVSSTYADLKEERQHIIQALMEMDCIPAGMELFPAADEEQWEFIKKVINDCDYYLLLIGGRYGSITPDGISYTEKEFDYAIEKGLKVVAFVHQNPGNIPSEKSEISSDSRDKLTQFRDKVTRGRLVKFWNNANELSGLVALSLTKTIKMYPAIGWVRANQVSNEELLTELYHLQQENKKILEDYNLIESQANKKTENISDIDSSFTIHFEEYLALSIVSAELSSKVALEMEVSWREIFITVAPHLRLQLTNYQVKNILGKSLLEYRSQKDMPIVSIDTGNQVFDPKILKSHHGRIEDRDFTIIGIQLQAYGLIEIIYKEFNEGSDLFWKLTEKGEQFMIESIIVRCLDSEN
jgi:hypothetical protein